MNDGLIYLASTSLWTRWLTIASFIQAFFFIITVVIAWTTLVGKKSLRNEENTRLLLKMWYEDKYNDELKVLFDNYEKYFMSNCVIDDCSIEEINNSIRLTDTIDHIRSFIKKLNYFLADKRIDLKNIDLYFSEIFYTDQQLSCRQLYNMLKDFNLKFGSKSIDHKVDRLSIIIFFRRIAKFKKNNDLLKDIENSSC